MSAVSRSLLGRLTPPRLLLVPQPLVIAFVALYALTLVPVAFALLLSVYRPEIAWPVHPANPFHAKLLCIVAMVYGLVRVMGYHPAYRKGYRKWLEQTPWTAGKRLPLGPVTLDWRDALPLGAIALLAHFHAGLDPAVPVAMFAFIYLAVTAATLAATEALASAAVVLAALPAVFLLHDRVGWGLLVMGATAAVAGFGLRRSLAAFPWRGRDAQSPTGIPSRRQLGKLPLGWPLDRLAPKPPPERKGRLTGWVGAALLAWWTYAGFTWATEARDTAGPSVFDAFTGSIFAGALAALFRWLCYVAGHHPHISLAGRLATGRLIIPRHDQILVAPACALLVSVGAPALLHAMGAGPIAIMSVSVGLVLGAVLTLGPTLHTWRLTGAHRMVAMGEGNAGNAQDADE